MPQVYEELRRLAAARIAHEAPGHTLEPTALVHEAYLRLAGDRRFADRGQFLASAALAMRRILVDHARARSTRKRDGGQRLDVDPNLLPAGSPDADVLAVDECLERLSRHEPRMAELVQLRYFGGLTIPEAARVLGISPRTADAWWAYARAWLAAELPAS